eukprot:PhM_4_TR18668/c1_g1_i9/m.19922
MGGCYSSAIASKPIQFQKQLSTVHNFSAVVDQRQQEQLRSPKPIPSPSEIVQLEDTNVASNNSSSCPTPRAVQTLSPRPSLSSQRAHSKSSSCLSSNGSTTGTAAYNPAAHTPTSETSGWATYRCPLVGWAVSHPPRWTSDRWVLRDGRHVVTVLRHPTQPSVSLHVTTEVAGRGVSVAEAFCSQVRFVEALPGLCSHHVCVSEWRVDFVSEGDDGNVASGCRVVRAVCDPASPLLRLGNRNVVFEVVFVCPQQRTLPMAHTSTSIQNSFSFGPNFEKREQNM